CPSDLAMIDSARAEGLDITIDAYPYTATSTGTAVLFPSWALAGGRDSLRARLEDPATRARIVEGIKRTILEERGGGDLSRIQLAAVSFNRAWEGKTYADIARERGREPDLDFAAELAIEIQLQGGASGVWHVVDEEDVRRIMRHPWTMISSDGELSALGRGHPHPRGYGAFARVLGHYVREEGVLTLEEAVRKMTSLPAWRIGQPERGRIAEGMLADIAVFDPARIRDRATFTEPHHFVVGVEHVLVHGVPVIVGASLTGEKPGRVWTRAVEGKAAGDCGGGVSALSAALALCHTEGAGLTQRRGVIVSHGDAENAEEVAGPGCVLRDAECSSPGSTFIVDVVFSGGIGAHRAAKRAGRGRLHPANPAPPGTNHHTTGSLSTPRSLRSARDPEPPSAPSRPPRSPRLRVSKREVSKNQTPRKSVSTTSTPLGVLTS